MKHINKALLVAGLAAFTVVTGNFTSQAQDFQNGDDHYKWGQQANDKHVDKQHGDSKYVDNKDNDRQHADKKSADEKHGDKQHADKKDADKKHGDNKRAGSKHLNNSRYAISRNQAANVALSRVPGATMNDVRDLEKDEQNNRPVWEGKIHKDGHEYEFTVDAVSGQIIEWDQHSDN